jgi:hypothetical protein
VALGIAVTSVDRLANGARHRETRDRDCLASTKLSILIGSIRRECLDRIIIGNERGLRRVLSAYVQYYLKLRTHLSLRKDAPVSRPVALPSDGEIVAMPELGGLHHRYERRAA